VQDKKITLEPGSEMVTRFKEKHDEITKDITDNLKKRSSEPDKVMTVLHTVLDRMAIIESVLAVLVEDVYELNSK